MKDQAAETIRVGAMPPPPDPEQLPPIEPAPESGGTTIITDVWPEPAIDSLAMLVKAPYAILSVRLGDHWMLSDGEASDLAHAIAGVIPYSKWLERAGNTSPWLVLGGQLLAVTGPRVMRTRAELAAQQGGPDAGPTGPTGIDNDRPGAPRGGAAPGGGRDPGAAAADPRVGAEDGGAFVRSADDGLSRLFGPRPAAGR